MGVIVGFEVAVGAVVVGGWCWSWCGVAVGTGVGVGVAVGAVVGVGVIAELEQYRCRICLWWFFRMQQGFRMLKCNPSNKVGFPYVSVYR